MNTRSRPLISITLAGSSNGRLESRQARATPSPFACLAGILSVRFSIQRLLVKRYAADCRILYVGSTEEHHLKEILAATDQAGVLTVSDIPGFSRRGGMIQFVMEGDRVRFEINLATAESAKLVLSSELLKVAAAVRRNARSGD